MAEAFIGYSVHVELANGSSLEGTVSHIDSHTQLLTLKNVNVKFNGHSQQLSIYGVAGADIKDLKIITSNSTSNTQQPYHVNSNVSTFENERLPSKSTTPAPNNVVNSILTQSQVQPPTIYSNSPFPDPAIISYSPAPIQQQSYPLSSPYGVSRASSPYVNLQQQHIDVQVPTKISQTTSTGDSDSKYDEEETTTNGYEENSKRTVNGSHVDSSGIESDVASYSHKKSPRRKKNQNSNGQYQNLRTHPSPARKFRRGRRQIHEWAGGDVNDFKSEEFDFQGNLDLFDKEKVFAEIRELDSTAPENLLVNINRNPNSRMNHRNGNHSNQNSQSKLASHENVLEVSARKSKFYHTDEEDETANDGEVDSDGSWKKKKKANGGDHRKVKIRTLTGVACPTVQPLQMVEVERIAALETGPNEDQMIENAGRGASMMCLQALGGSRRIQPNNHNAAPLVVVLAGNNKTGTYGLATARHLANHGCHVIACVVGKETDLLKSVAFQQKILLPTSGKIVKTVEDLPQQFTNPVDLIVDALLGYQFTLRDIVDEHDKRLICDLMDWANNNKAPVLSLDMPSGVNGNTGSPVNSAHYIHPKWTLCLGAPKSGCKSRTVTGELFLADIGVPRVCWKRIGVKGWGMPWGSEYLVGLEYST